MRAQPVVLAVVALLGVGLAVGWLLGTGPTPPPAPPGATARATRPAASAVRAPVDEPTPTEPPVPVAAPAPTPPPVDESPEAVARWQAEAPVAQHAVRDAHRWQTVAGAMRAAGREDLALQAESMAMRLQRATRPQPEDQVRDLLIEEINLFRSMHAAAPPSDIEELLKSIEMGAHHAIQGAPTPEVTAEIERQLLEQRQSSR